MKLRKLTAVILCVLLLISMLPSVTAAGVNGYYNVDYLEAEAAAAYGEEGLGAVYTPQATTWKLWSPTARHVQLRLYATGSDEEDGAAGLGTYSMTQNAETGVWSLTLQGDYKNVYYTYLVTARGVTRETRDIYAKAAGVNGYRSMVVDLDATDPAGWENDSHVLLDESTDAVIWEVHVRDFSIDPSSGVSQANRGKFLAFTEDGTSLNGEADELSTCVNYLKEMGVNTVHLLPVYDFGSVDETVTDDPTNRNWGYDPINYNVPEGSYSTDPYNGNTRITEFKQMIQALHEAGICVVMDVVYNHTYDVDSYEWGARLLYNNAFNDSVPGYYFRMSGPSSWYNGSGCGNVTASDKLMYRKYMIESVRYWAEEYHIDGFRFDLMGCHDVETMNLIRAELDTLDGGEGRKILMYGEPWTGGDAGIANGCTQNNAQTYGLSERIGLFCDWMRDAIKGNPDGDTWGWIQGDTTQAAAVLGGLSANDGRLSARSQTVTYADAHDNLILWDKLVRSNGGSDYGDYSSAEAQTWLKQLNLAKTIVLMSQGMAFNVAGTEFARSKQGDHNSYNVADSVNAINWNVRKTNAASADYYKGLIQIRNAFSPITDPDAEYGKYSLEGSDNSCIAVRIPNETAGEWRNLILILNDAASSATVTLPEGDWTLIADGTQAGLSSLGSCSGSYTVPGYGSAILVNDTAITPEEPEPDSDFYLVGWINGADYGCGADSANKGIYRFENGSLTASFTQDSYVYLKTGDNSSWYMTDGWQGTGVTSAVLYNTESLSGTGDKLFVPGGYEVHFSLTQNADGTLTLSYTADGYTPGQEPEPSSPDYYLIGYINGADYGCNDDWQNLGDYHFVNGSLSASFTQDSYVFVKTGDNANWFMTDGWLGSVSSATLYNTGSHSFANGTNKLYVPGNTALTFTLTENSDGSLNLSYAPAGSQSASAEHRSVTAGSDEAKDAVILHCWNWSYDTIRENLAQIKAAGYTAVQTSPAQPHSGYRTGEIPTGDWWMLYQPLGLHIAGENESWLGDADDLAALCAAAHQQGIEVIVDVVSNHLCNGYNDIAAGGVDPYDESQVVATSGDRKGYQFEVQPDSRVLTHNPELTGDKFRSDYIFCNDSSTEATVHGNIGMPDLKTEDAVVQSSVLSYLKELIDVGVDGFRFDAAKHIETPSDGTYASQFWPTVIDGAQAYAESKGRDLWAYGEVLSTAGHDRKMNYYAPYIDMTEISYAYTITEGFGKTHSASQVANQQFKDWLGVGVETLANSDLVLMAESHDTYAQSEGSFSVYGSEIINKAWAVAAARADASALYFARPLGYTQEDGPIGSLGACEDYNWKNTEVAEANKFHTAFIGAAETVYAAGDLVVVERYSDLDCGAVIANATGFAGSVSFNARQLTDGTYYDQITGNEFSVSGGAVSGQLGTTGIAVLRKTAPVSCEHPADQRYTVTKAATCTEDGYEAVYCHECGRMVELLSSTPALGHVDANGDKRCDRCNTFLGTVAVYFVDSLDWVSKNDYFTNIKCYAFGEGGENAPWPGLDAEIVGRSTDDHGIWKVEVNPEAWQYVKFVAFDAEGAELKTVNLAFAEAGTEPVVYAATENTVSSDYGAEYSCDAVNELSAVCAHSAYTVVTANGAEARLCDCCGALLRDEQVEPVLDESIVLYNSIGIGIEIQTTFGVRKTVTDRFENWYIEVSKLDEAGNVTETRRFNPEDVEEGFIMNAVYTDITAKEMGVRYAASFHGFAADGSETYSNTVTNTVRDYVIGELVKSDNDDATRRLAADLLNYGAAAQVYFNFDAESLVNANLSAEAQAAMAQFADVGEAPATLENGSNGPNVYGSVSVMNRVVLSLTVRGLGTPSQVQILVKNHETGETKATVDAVQRGSVWMADYAGFEAEDMRTAFDFVPVADGTETGTPLTWSVEGYAREARLNEDSTQAELALFNALLHYIDAVIAAYGN
ncbi:MAG: type I pullulanase [Oscillospiraceae bacterium]|nr:type I pullulanase [Oscillospiraceae bacterium]MBR7010266.1 type I pullulanase [Oscillospiraceae bacterium]